MTKFESSKEARMKKFECRNKDSPFMTEDSTSRTSMELPERHVTSRLQKIGGLRRSDASGTSSKDADIN